MKISATPEAHFVIIRMASEGPDVVVGPIPWGHSGPLCHALSLSSLWTSHASYSYSAGGVRCPQRRQRQRVTEGTAMAPWNGPNNAVQA